MLLHGIIVPRVVLQLREYSCRDKTIFLGEVGVPEDVQSTLAGFPDFGDRFGGDSAEPIQFSDLTSAT